MRQRHQHRLFSKANAQLCLQAQHSSQAGVKELLPHAYLPAASLVSEVTSSNQHNYTLGGCMLACWHVRASSTLQHSWTAHACPAHLQAAYDVPRLAALAGHYQLADETLLALLAGLT